MDNNEVFKKFILKQIAGEVVFSKERNSFQLSLRSISNSIREAIFREGHKWNMTDKAIEDYVNTLIGNAEMEYKPRRQTVQDIDVSKDLRPGLELWLYSEEHGRGKARLRLLYIGKSNTTGHCRFMVLYSSRLGLQPEDIVEPADNTIWAIEYRVMLCVYRHGIRYPDHSRVYRTYQLVNIEKILPSHIHEIVDDRSEFTYVEYVSNILSKETKALSFGRNPMSLLLHDHSQSFPLYADFNKEGLGEFKTVQNNTVFKPSKVRDAIFDITNETLQGHALSIETKEPGLLYLATDSLQLCLKQPAKVEVKEIH